MASSFYIGTSKRIDERGPPRHGVKGRALSRSSSISRREVPSVLHLYLYSFIEHTDVHRSDTGQSDYRRLFTVSVALGGFGLSESPDGCLCERGLSRIPSPSHDQESQTPSSKEAPYYAT